MSISSLVRRVVLILASSIALLAAPAAFAGETDDAKRGGSAVLLPSSFDVSPDGTRVVFAWRGDLWAAPTTGGRIARLTSHDAQDSTPRFSPDGREIAFVSSRDAGNQVYVMPADGGQPKQLTWHTDGYRLEQWYPDGKGLLVNASRDAHWRFAQRFMRIDRTKRLPERALFEAFGRDGRLSPDGTKIAFVREGERWWRRGYRGERAAQIWIHDLGTKTFTKVSEDRVPHEWPLWSADGTHLYYVSEKSGARNLWTYDVAAKTRKQLTDSDDDVTFPAISRDGGTIVFRKGLHLFAMPADGSAKPAQIDLTYGGDTIWPATERKLFKRATDVAMTSDGKQIAFIAGGDVFVMDKELREPRRVTATPAPETEVCFTSDDKTLLIVGERGAQVDVWRAKRKDASKYWWLNRDFEVERVTNDAIIESDVRLRPDGKRLAYVANGGELWTMKLDGTDKKMVVKSWDRPRYRWSPDGEWFAYSVQDDDFNSDIWVVKADGSKPPYNISRHPDDDRAPVWSPDGRRIAFVGKRTHDEVDVYYVNLRKEDEDRSGRDRRLKKAMDEMKKGAKSKKAKSSKKKDPKKSAAKKNKKADDPSAANADDDKPKKKKQDKSKKKDKGKKKNAVKIDFDGLHERIHRITVRDSRESGLVWSLDSKKIHFNATVKGDRGFYAVEIESRSPKPKRVSASSVSGAEWLPKAKKLVGLSRGLPALMTDRGKISTYAFDAKVERDLAGYRAVAFDAAWRVMNERFYDGGFNNKDWNAVREKYRPAAHQCLGNAEFSTLVNMMLGELNASHMGFRATGGGRRGPSGDAWRPSTVHLGVRFDLDYAGPGLKIADVIPGGPADRTATRLKEGEVIASIDGLPVDRDTDLTTVLNQSTDHDYLLTVIDAKENARNLAFRATTTRAVRRLLYEKLLDDRSTMTGKLSDGTLGYVHIAGMNWRSFERFEAELYAKGYGKDGLVIDVRDNGGGSTTDHLLTVLCQPQHAITVPRGGGRGYPHGRRVYATWHKPIVVLCNQNSYSNAEIFSHAIKNLGRGKVVGVQTAGGVISTGSARVLDVGSIRVPFRAWFLPNGEDMELMGAMPDFVVWPKPGEMARGVDRQLEKAVAVLLDDVKAWKAKPKVTLKYARERVKSEAKP